MKTINELIIRAQMMYAEGRERLEKRSEEGSWFEGLPWSAIWLTAGAVLAVTVVGFISDWAIRYFTEKLNGIS